MKSGKIAVIGKANAGKSTLVNVLVGEKIAIVSPKPQTTRDRIMGILNADGYQMVFEDTPGFYKAKTELNRKMQRVTKRTVDGVDIILFVVDCHRGIFEDDLNLLKSITSNDIPIIVVLSKTDITVKERIPESLVKISEIEGIKEVIPVSARKGKNVKELLKILEKYLPEQDAIERQDIISDKSEKFMVSEILREKILLCFDKEVPHGVAITVNEFYKNEKGVYIVNLDIVCEKQNHKSILIGKQGQAIKKVSEYARKDMEKFLGAKVFLTTYVKVKESWRDNEGLIKEFGYNEGEF